MRGNAFSHFCTTLQLLGYISARGERGVSKYVEIVLNSVLGKAHSLIEERVCDHRLYSSREFLRCELVQVSHDVQCWEKIFLHGVERHINVAVSYLMELLTFSICCM
jgi:hypothetical protein